MKRIIRSITNSSLLTKFGLISLIAMTLIGLVLGQLLERSIKSQVLAGAIAEAEVVSRLGLQDAVRPSEIRNGLSPERVRALQLSIRSDFARIDVVDVELWDLDRTVIFATDTSVIGTTSESSDELTAAAAGTPVARITDVTNDESADRLLRRHGTVVHVYQPVRFGSIDNPENAGVLRTSIPYEPIAQSIAEQTRRLYLALACAFFLLYILLFRLVANASAELRMRADENEKQARHDALTGLPNRMLFAEELDTILDQEGSESLAIALIDLDRFKEVNDTLGHHHGDLLLVEVGRRLEESLRPGDAVARLGGDEFALVLTDVADERAALAVAKRLVHEIETPFEVEGLQLDIGASVGLAMAPQHGSDLVTLLQRADIAMYQAKRSGVGCALYDSSDDHNSREQLSMASELRQSMADQLTVYYQPKIDLGAGQPCGVEALVRWNHPEHGLIMPDTFIPLAERGGMMNSLTMIVLEKSLAQLRQWLHEGRDLHLAVNVSARGLHNREFVTVVGDLLLRHQVPAERLVLEITETTIAEDPEGAREVLAQLQDLGVRFSIDDFGTGHSSLALLRSLPVSELKIDRSFISDLSHPEGLAIVDYSVQLGHMLGLAVVAEGVEQETDQTELRKLGCDIAQGYWYARPMPAEDLNAWLDDPGHRPLPPSPTARPATGAISTPG